MVLGTKLNMVRKLFVTLRSVANHPLNRRRRLASMRDFCIAQVAARMLPGDISVPFPNQTQLLISPRMKGAAHFISPGLFEYEVMAFAMHFLRAEDVFVDAGANVGAYMLLASGVAGAKSIAIEPSPVTFDYLRRNVLLNELATKVTTVHAALGRAEGKLRLTDNLGTENYVCPESDHRPSVEVTVSTLDDLLRDVTPTLIKIDVEGFEAEVLGGAENTLGKSSLQAMIIERSGIAQRYGYDEAALHRHIRAMSFAPCAYVPSSRTLHRIPEESLGNIIYIRNLDAAKDRLRAAPAFRFAGVAI